MTSGQAVPLNGIFGHNLFEVERFFARIPKVGPRRANLGLCSTTSLRLGNAVFSIITARKSSDKVAASPSSIPHSALRTPHSK